MNKYNISVITIVKNRTEQLRNQISWLKKGSHCAKEHIVVNMGADLSSEMNTSDVKLLSCQSDHHVLPLAKARNMGLKAAQSELVFFLDVDCLPEVDLLDSFVESLATKTILSAVPCYLPFVPSHHDDDEIRAAAIVHPKRRNLDFKRNYDWSQFWSLAFGGYRRDLIEAGGFDESYSGYGAEDTDFGQRLKKFGAALRFFDAKVYHQYHVKYNPPINYLGDIVQNANTFREKWNWLPMKSWLRKMESMGLIEIGAERVKLLREADKAEIDACYSTASY